MGTRGPAPKRSDQRRRRNQPERPVEKVPARAAEAPPANSTWHPTAKRWYESLSGSPQSCFYAASDWGMAYATAEALSRELKPQFLGLDGDGKPIVRSVPVKGATLAAFLKANAQLLATEADRRRVGVEVERGGRVDADEDAAVTALDDYRRRIESG